MAESQEDKIARQARLSKALSAAYLSHQINQLEDKVQGAEAGRRSGSPSTHRGGGGGGRGGGGGGGHRGNGQHGRGGGGGGGRIGQDGQGRHGGSGGGHDRERTAAQQPRRVVLDTSALLFALPRIRNLIKNQAELVIPLEALNTLDLLKKSMHPLSVKARQATRFIEDAQEKTRHQARQQGDLDEFEPGQYRQGLWIQDEMETDNNLGWEPLAEIRADGGELGQDQDRGGDDCQERDEGMPTYVASTLQCASFFRHIWELAEDAPILVVCPETLDPAQAADRRENEEGEPHIIRFGDRARGHAIRQWAEIMGIGCLDFTAPPPPNAGGGQSRQLKGGNASGRENTGRNESKTTLLKRSPPGAKASHEGQIPGMAATRPLGIAAQAPQPIRLLRPEHAAIGTRPPALLSSPQQQQHAPSQPTSPALRGGLTKEALERSQALLEAQEMEEAAKRRENSEMHRIQNEQRRGLEDQTANGSTVRAPGGAPISLLARPRGQDVRLSPGGHGRAPAKMDKDGIKLLRPDPNQPISVLPRQSNKGAGKANGKSNGPSQVKSAGQAREKPPPFVLLQRPK